KRSNLNSQNHRSIYICRKKAKMGVAWVSWAYCTACLVQITRGLIVDPKTPSAKTSTNIQKSHQRLLSSSSFSTSTRSPPVVWGNILRSDEEASIFVTVEARQDRSVDNVVGTSSTISNVVLSTRLDGDLKHKLAGMHGVGQNYHDSVLHAVDYVLSAAERMDGLRQPRPLLQHALHVATFLSSLGLSSELVVAAVVSTAVQKHLISLQEVGFSFGAEVEGILQEVMQLDRVEERTVSFSQNKGSSLNAQRDLAGTLLTLLSHASTRRDALVLHLALKLGNLQSSASAVKHDERSCEEVQATARFASRQALLVYAPLAHRLGLNPLKNALEAEGFRRLYPRSSAHVEQLLAEQSIAHAAVLKGVVAGLEGALAGAPGLAAGLAGEQGARYVAVEGRVKQPYSVWCKMVRKGCAPKTGGAGSAGGGGNSAGGFRGSLDDVMDIVGVRLVVDPAAAGGDDGGAASGEGLCYGLRRLVRGLWAPAPGRAKDYVARPKANGYRALHDTVAVPWRAG
ncbi:unnamed protein product, partial [Heterosigma akashiwo]